MNCASKPGRLELNCPISAAAKARNDPLLSEVDRSSAGLGLTSQFRLMALARLRR